MDTHSIEEAVEELQPLVQADGAAFAIVESDPEHARVQLRLDLSQVTCEECVLPPDLLKDMVQSALRTRLAAPLDVELDDPRVAATG